MKRIFCFIIATFALSVPLKAQDAYYLQDSLRNYDIDIVEVTTVNAKRTTPIAQDNLSKESLERSAYGSEPR